MTKLIDVRSAKERLDRRQLLVGTGAAALTVVAGAARGDDSEGTHETEEMQVVQRGGLYANLHDPKITELPPSALVQRFIYSPAPKADPEGRWNEAPPLPIPRSEMAWATAEDDRMHVIGGYAEQQVARAYHHVFSAATNAWSEAAPIPRGANHIGVAALNGMVYAIGGFVEQNRVPVPDCYAYEVADNRWRAIRPAQRGSRGAISVVGLDGMIHAIGGRDTRSVDWHEVYDPTTDVWRTLAPIPGPRDHAAAVTIDGVIYVVGGRMDTFDFNTGMHVVYDPQARSLGGARAYADAAIGARRRAPPRKAICNGRRRHPSRLRPKRAYDPQTDSWRSYAAMPTPRHGMGAAVVGDAIHVAGGGPMNGGSFQSAVHEQFTI